MQDLSTLACELQVPKQMSTVTTINVSKHLKCLYKFELGNTKCLDDTNLLSNIQVFILSNIQTFISPNSILYKHL